MNVSSLIPPHSWDSHMHVVDPSTYPLARTATYTPAPHTLTSALTYYSALSTPPLNVVLVQPSIYGNDNSCLLDALRTLGPARARGVVTFDPLTTDFGPLQDAHRLGVRGVRVNLYSVGKEMDETGLRAELQAYADVIKEIGWVLQLYVPLKMVPLLERIVPELGVTVCLDHFGQPALPLPGSKERYATSKDPYDLEGFGSLIRLLRQGSTYVKMSAPYRISKQDDMSDLEPLAKEILNVAGRSRVVFATDWPHTRFEGVDIRPFIERVLDWCGQDEELVERVFKGNAEDLWGVGR